MKTRNRTTLAAPLAYSRLDGWDHISPVGDYPGAVGGVDVIQVLSREHLEAIADTLNKRAADESWTGILGDREHFSLDPNKETDALAWYREFEMRADGLYGKPRETTLGVNMVGGGVLRGISPVFDVITEDGGPLKSGCRVIPTGLDSIGFTNRPRLGSAMRPLTNRADGDTALNSNQQPTNQKKDSMKALNKALGLAEDAEETAAVLEVQKLKNRAETAEAKAAAMEAEKLDADADAFVTANRGRVDDTDEARAQLKKLYTTNREQAEAFVKIIPPRAPNSDPKLPQSRNKTGAKQPEGLASGSMTEQQAAKVSNRATELQAQAKAAGRVLNHADAWRQAKTEVMA